MQCRQPRRIALLPALLTLVFAAGSSEPHHWTESSNASSCTEVTEEDVSLFQTLAKVTGRVAVEARGGTQLEGNLSLKPSGSLNREQTLLFQTRVSVGGNADIVVAGGSPKLRDQHGGKDIGLDDDPEISPLRYEIEEGTGQLNKLTHQGRWVGWVRPGLREANSTGDASGTDFFRSAPPGQWIALGAVCVVLCIVDGLVLKRAPDSFRWHLAIIVIWMILASFYLLGVWLHLGHDRGIEWVSGYVLEWMLSLDNLFIFHLVFKTYQTPKEQIPKAVFIGIIGAVVMRMVFFLIVSTLLQTFGWFRWPFGLLLVWSGIEAVRGEDDDGGDVKETRLVRVLRFCFGNRVMDGYDTQGPSIFVFDPKTGKVQLSLLFIVIVLVEFSDIIFALDSVSAKVAQIPNQYIAFSSSVLAMYGLRAMFFIIEDLVDKFELLKYGLGFILVLIGVELMIGHWFHVPSGLECVIIVSVFVVCIVSSSVRSFVWPDTEGNEVETEKADSEEPSPEPSPSPVAHEEKT